MSFAQAVKTCFAKFATFSGRAPRAEYWWFALFVVLLSIVTGVIDAAVFGAPATDTATADPADTFAASPVQSLAGLAVFLPHLSVAWRRMHDSGRSGLYALAPLLLLIAALGVFVFGIGAADMFAPGGSMDILFTRLTLLITIPTLLVLLISPLLMLWWLTRPSQPGANRYGPHPYGVET